MSMNADPSPLSPYGFRDRRGRSPRALYRRAKVVEAFDRFEPQTEHMRLTIELPSAFFRYAMTECMSYRDWGVLRATLDYGYHGVEIVTGVAEQSHIAGDVKVNRYGVDGEEGYARYRLEQSAPLQLSLADAQRFVIFLMNHFLCFDLTITTRLSK